MAEQIFIRSRGRIQGPFTTEQLHALAGRGSFSRAHEVSADGVTWSRAATRPDLFPTIELPAAQIAFVEPTPPPVEQPPVVASAPPRDVWYFCQLGQRHGPVDFGHLQYLVKMGQLLPDDIVWTEGFADWLPANRVPKLFGSNASTVSNQSPSMASTGGAGAVAKTCPFCAEPIEAAAIKCKHCGSMLVPNLIDAGRFPTARSSGAILPPQNPNSPLLIALLSGCCIAGLGQIILGQTAKGVMILLGSMVLAVLTGGLSIFVTWPLGAIDAYCIASKLKRGQSVGTWESF